MREYPGDLLDLVFEWGEIIVGALKQRILCDGFIRLIYDLYVYALW